MTKKYHMRRHFKGGFLDSLGQTFSNLGTSISQGASSVWNKTKKATGMDNTSSYSSSSSYTPSTTSTYTPSTPSTTSTYTPSTTSTPSTYTPSAPSTTSTTSTTSTYSYGGKRLRNGTRKIKRTRRMKKGGNFSYNTPIDTLASRAGDYSRGLTARVNDLVGGKRRRNSRKSRKARR
jgi:cytoskeletal protein RodZ